MDYYKWSRSILFTSKHRVAKTVRVPSVQTREESLIVAVLLFYSFSSFASEQINGDIAGTVDVGGNGYVLLENEGDLYHEKTSHWY